MAKVRAKSKAKKENAVIRYLKDTRAELRRVHWPSAQEARNLTTIVLIVTIGMTILLGLLLDNLFAWELAGLITGDPWRIGLAVGVGVVVVVLVLVLSRRAG